MTFGSLGKHVGRIHPTLHEKRGKTEKYIASVGQTIPDDPDFVEKSKKS